MDTKTIAPVEPVESLDDGKIEDAIVHDPAAERRLCRKFDIRILPLLAVLYLFNALDKGNISNAKTDGLEDDINMKGNQWNILLSIFYIPFVLSALPFMLVMKKYNPANVLPIMGFCFGSLSLISASVKNFGGLMAVRWFLGMTEAAILPGTIYYLSMFYRRTELARRLAIFYAAANISNAFSGLLAFGVFQIDGALYGWQYLFLIEGAGSLVVAFIAFIFLPRTIEGTRFLNDDEKALAFLRIQTDSSSVVGEKIKFTDALATFKHPVTWAWVLTEICLGVPLNSINNWFPQIIQELGKGTVKTNLYTVAPNISGAICLLFFAFASDFLTVRSIFIVCSLAVSLIGFVVFGAIDVKANIGAAYFSCFLMTAGASSSSVLTSTWYNNNTPGETRRAVLSAIGIPLANAAGLISSNIFLAKDAPKYTMALGITAGFGGLGIIIVSLIALYMAFDNRRRNRAQGVNWTFKDVSTGSVSGPDDPKFRWML